MAKIKTDEEITRDILTTIRNINEGISEKKNGKKLLREAEDREKSNAIAITDDPMFGQNVLTNQIQSFRSSVEGGAQFSKPENEDVASSPLIYLPDDGNLVFSGVIPCLNNLKWQFVLKTSTGNGCFTWCDGLILTKENMAILNKLYGYYVNWKESWTMEASDLEALANHFKENQ
jgi:hypothetical protein